MRSPAGSPARIGKWAVYGASRGFQRGREGMSYAVETIRRPGQPRSTPLADIENQLVDLCGFATAHPELTFYMTAIGARFAGYSNAEMLACFQQALHRAGGAPQNFVIPADLYA